MTTYVLWTNYPNDAGDHWKEEKVTPERILDVIIERIAQGDSVQIQKLGNNHHITFRDGRLIRTVVVEIRN